MSEKIQSYRGVTTLVVVWIEIALHVCYNMSPSVTTLVVVWIEIIIVLAANVNRNVTTLVVVWIEIKFTTPSTTPFYRHHSRSGVD